jgi:hypothetical protein
MVKEARERNKSASLKKSAMHRKKTHIYKGKKIVKSGTYPNLLEGRPFNIKFI